jgi:hypothetical protein
MAKTINETSRNFAPSFGIKEDKMPGIYPKDLAMKLSNAIP